MEYMISVFPLFSENLHLLNTFRYFTNPYLSILFFLDFLSLSTKVFFLMDEENLDSFKKLLFDNALGNIGNIYMHFISF